MDASVSLWCKYHGHCMKTWTWQWDHAPEMGYGGISIGQTRPHQNYYNKDGYNSNELEERRRRHKQPTENNSKSCSKRALSQPFRRGIGGFLTDGWRGRGCHIYIYIYIYVHTCMYVYVYIYICMYRERGIYIYIYIYNVYRCIHIWVCIYIYICRYLYLSVGSSWSSMQNCRPARPAPTTMMGCSYLAGSMLFQKR